MKSNFVFLTVLLGFLSMQSGFSATISVPSTADPWLAGMTNGATASGGDVAPAQSPVEVTGLTINPGELLLFTASGTVVNHTNRTMYGPEGNTTNVLAHQAGAQNGISSCTAPIDALMGVFLGSSLPSLTTAPASLSFGTQAARDYTTLSPALKQVFFIGNGSTTSGTTQTIRVPVGATRLFLGPMDGTTWYDNAGTFTVTIVPLPRLTVQHLDHSNIAINWPTNSSGFTLEETVSLLQPVWTSNANTRVVIGDQFVAVVDRASPQHFFRLRKR